MSLKNLIKAAGSIAGQPNDFDTTALTPSDPDYPGPVFRVMPPQKPVKTLAEFCGNYRELHSKTKKVVDAARHYGPKVRAVAQAMMPAVQASKFGSPIMQTLNRASNSYAQLSNSLRNSALVNRAVGMYNNASNNIASNYNALSNRVANSNIANKMRATYSNTANGLNKGYQKAVTNFNKLKYAPQIKQVASGAAKGISKGTSAIKSVGGTVTGTPLFGGAFLAANNGDWDASAGDAAKYYENLINRGATSQEAYAKAYGYGGVRWLADAVNNTPASVAEVANIPNYFSLGYIPKFVNSDDAKLTNFAKNSYNLGDAYVGLQMSALENASLERRINAREKKLKFNSLTPEQQQAQRQGENAEARQAVGWSRNAMQPTRTWGGAIADAAAQAASARASLDLATVSAGRAMGRSAVSAVTPTSIKDYANQTKKTYAQDQARQFHHLSQAQQQQQLQGDNAAQRQTAGWSRKAMQPPDSWADRLVKNIAWWNGAKY